MFFGMPNIGHILAYAKGHSANGPDDLLARQSSNLVFLHFVAARTFIFLDDSGMTDLSTMP